MYNLNLDDQKIYKRLDIKGVAKSIELLPAQIKQVLKDLHSVKIPKEFRQCTKILVNGMGGSSTGARIVKSVFARELKVPFNIEPGYVLHDYVDKNTLYIIVSYSGTTEEPLTTYEEAKKRGAKILAIAENNPKTPLYKLIKKNNIPGYIFTPTNNISNQPRLGVGYTMFGIIYLLMRVGFLNIKEKVVENYLAQMKIDSKKFSLDKPTKNNQAKKIAKSFLNHAVVLVGAEHLEGNLYSFRNQINECAKQFSTYLTLSDLNHFAMEGLVNPKSNKNNLIFFFIDSKLYHPRIQERSKLTKQVVAKNGIKVVSSELKSTTKINQAFEFLQLGSWISYYLGMLNGVDPVKIPWVDWFKKELK